MMTRELKSRKRLGETYFTVLNIVYSLDKWFWFDVTLGFADALILRLHDGLNVASCSSEGRE